MEKAKKRGGKRHGAGRPKEFEEETSVVSFVVPISQVVNFRAYCRQFLDKFKI